MADEDTWLRAGTRLADRYDVRARLGAGGMGVVYEVLDLVSGEPIALKTLRRGIADPAIIKREFRALADVAHPNVVQLYDLFDDRAALCLTMELVRGVDLMTELRGAEQARHTMTLAAVDEDTAPARSLGDFWPAHDLEAVRDRFAQLARGLGALHGRGIVHRDIKPHNVRVTPEGRVVLLDFGLAAGRGDAGTLAGTVAYMAPEQTEGVPVSPSADWYSFGILLHEVLTGQLPWPGAGREVLARKRVEDAPSLRGRPGIPDDLAGLVGDLVVRDPDARLGGQRVLDVLGRRKQPRFAPSRDQVGGDLVGRDRELAELLAAWAGVVAGGSAWIAVEGESGVGKTTLLDAFSASAAAAGAVVLRGRCYEREAVAYKGVDQIVEILVERLAALGETCPEAADLVEAFPVAREIAGDSPVAVGHERHGGALRELVARLASHAAVLVVLDDVQWADRDCLALLARALQPPGIPRVLVVVGARLDAGARWTELPMPFARHRVGPLDEAGAIELAQRLLGRASLGVDARALARASGGSPLEIVERVRAAMSDDAPTTHGARDLVVARAANAPADVQLVVAYAVIAGAPIPLAAIADATRLDARTLAGALDRAQLAGLVRSRRSGGRAVVEPAHDQVREVLFAATSPRERTQHAAALAPALERLGHGAALVAELYVLACMPDAARRCAEDAARRMASLGGHDAAANLWHRVADLATSTDARRDAMRNRADALALAGRGSEAAEVYLAGALDRGADRGRRMRDLRRAAEELLRAGRFADGLAAVEDALPNWRATPSPAAAMALGLSLHALTRAGLVRGHVARAMRVTGDGGPEEARELVDLRWAAIAGYTLGSPGHFILAVEVYLRAALALGDPERVALAWTAEATLATFMGSVRYADDCLDRASAALAGVDAPRARVVAIATAGLVRLNEGNWRRVEELVREAIDLADRRAVSLVWERNTAAISFAVARFHRGDLAALARDVRRERERTAARGDLYAHELLHSGFTVIADLRADDIAQASAALTALDDRPTGVLTAWLRAVAHALVATYGDAPALREVHARRARDLVASLTAVPILRSPILLGTIAWTRAAVDLVAGRVAGAAPWIARLARSPLRGMRALGELFAGHAAALSGDRATARARGAVAELALLAEDMAPFAASARWLVDPTTWPAWRDELAKAGAVRPEAFARLFAPALRA